MAQKTTQQQKTATAQKSISYMNGVSAVLPPLPPPAYSTTVPQLFPPKLKPTEKASSRFMSAPASRKGYVSDLMHSELNIYGQKTKIGISRPLVKRGRRKK